MATNNGAVASFLRTADMVRIFYSTNSLWCEFSQWYKILWPAPSLVGVCSSVTRGHSLRLQKNRTKYDLCKFCFSNRIVNIWNSLPSYVVPRETVNCFKTRLDRFWLNQGRVQYEGQNFFPSVEFFSYLINVLNHFLCLLHRMSRDRNVYWPPLK